MLTGKDLIERGWPQGPAEGLGATGMDDDTILRELEKVKAAPDSVPDKALEPLARGLTHMRDEETAALEDKLRGEALPYGVWGADLIEAGTTLDGGRHAPARLRRRRPYARRPPRLRTARRRRSRHRRSGHPLGRRSGHRM